MKVRKYGRITNEFPAGQNCLQIRRIAIGHEQADGIIKYHVDNLSRPGKAKQEPSGEGQLRQWRQKSRSRHDAQALSHFYHLVVDNACIGKPLESCAK